MGFSFVPEHLFVVDVGPASRGILIAMDSMGPSDMQIFMQTLTDDYHARVRSLATMYGAEVERQILFVDEANKKIKLSVKTRGGDEDFDRSFALDLVTIAEGT